MSKKISKEVLAQMAKTMSVWDIARSTGHSQNTIYKYCKGLGLTVFRHKPGRKPLIDLGAK